MGEQCLFEATFTVHCHGALALSFVKLQPREYTTTYTIFTFLLHSLWDSSSLIVPKSTKVHIDFHICCFLHTGEPGACFEAEQCIFVWGKVIVRCSRLQDWNVWVQLWKLILNCKLCWKCINSKSWMWAQWRSTLLGVKVCFFSWMRQQLLWDSFGTHGSHLVHFCLLNKVNNVGLESHDCLL